MIHVMAATGLGGTAMSAPVVGYDAIAVLEEEQHLRVPIVGRQWPAVAKHDGLAFAPVLVVDLRAVFRRDRRHGLLSLVTVGVRSEIAYHLGQKPGAALGLVNPDLNQARRSDVVVFLADLATASLIEVWIDETERRTWFLSEVVRKNL